MCVKTIVDASAFGHLCERLPKSAGGQLRDWIDRGDGVIVFSGAEETYARELGGYPKAVDLLASYVDRGCAIDIDKKRIQVALSEIPDPPVRQSNDAHILALAVASRATVLFSCDNPLRSDFTNRQVTGDGQRRYSVPDLLQSPKDTTKASRRRKFLARRKCPVSQ